MIRCLAFGAHTKYFKSDSSYKYLLSIWNQICLPPPPPPAKHKMQSKLSCLNFYGVVFEISSNGNRKEGRLYTKRQIRRSGGTIIQETYNMDYEYNFRGQIIALHPQSL